MDAENTLVMFSSDNGTSFDVGGLNASYFHLTAGLRGRKQDLYEGGIREPFIARWPGRIRPGTVTDHLSVQYDLMATLAELTGIGLKANDGISFLPTLVGKDKEQKQHSYIYYEFPEKSGQVAIRLGKWKGIKSNMKKDRNAGWEIYDVENDERETRDVSSLHPELVKQFTKILQREHQPSHIREWEFIDPKFPVEGFSGK